MDEEIRQFGDQLGRLVLARDWAGVHARLAPWLQREATAESVREFFEQEYLRTLEANGVDGLHYPGYPDPEVGGNTFINATGLREPISWEGGRVRPVADEVTDANMRFWMQLRLQCSDEQMEALGFDTFSDTWIAVVTTGGGLRVGYWSQGAY